MYITGSRFATSRSTTWNLGATQRDPNPRTHINIIHYDIVSYIISSYSIISYSLT